MHASSVYRLRQALALDPPGTPVRVIELMQMLGEVDDRLLTALGVDVVGVRGTRTKFGFALERWKEWRLFDGTPVLVPGSFNTAVEPDGSILQYPQGDPTAPASGRMPAGGWYFDAIVRQEPIDESRLDPADNLEEFGPISPADLDWMEAETRRLSAGRPCHRSCYRRDRFRRHLQRAGSDAAAASGDPGRGGVVRQHPDPAPLHPRDLRAPVRDSAGQPRRGPEADRKPGDRHLPHRHRTLAPRGERLSPRPSTASYSCPSTRRSPTGCTGARAGSASSIAAARLSS